MGIIYQATNKKNGKKYIGKTILSLKDRARNHKYSAEVIKSKWIFCRAIRKYGFDSFEWIVLFEDVDDCDLSAVEVACIKLLKTKTPNGYNMTDGGGGVYGWKHTKESKRKIGLAHAGKKLSDEHIEFLRKINTGRKLSDTRKKEISEHFRKLWEDESLRSKMVARRIGNQYALGNKHTEEFKKKIALVHKGKPKTMEQRRKMSEARKRWWVKRRREESNAIS